MSIFKWPDIIHWKRDARNGLYPSSDYITRCARTINHAVAFRRKEVFSRSWELGGASGSPGTVNLVRFRFRSGYGAARLRFFVAMGLDDLCAAVTPTCEIDVTEVGVGTTSLDAIAYGHQCLGTDDPPGNIFVGERTCTITAGATYTVLVKAVSYARILSLIAFEEASLTVSEATNYYCNPSVGPVYDHDRERLLVGTTNLHKQNAGTLIHWGMSDGSARTAVGAPGATLTNIVDNSSTGYATSSTPGYTINNTYRNTSSRSVVPYELAVYGSIGAGSGTVRVSDSSTDHITCTINGAAGWYTATGTLPNSNSKIDFRFNNDGVNTLSVYAISLIEYEA